MICATSAEVLVSSITSMPSRILCVDDRVSSLEVRRAMLTKLGYDVLLASDPDSALAIMDKVDVDLVVLDYSFPGDMSGEDLAHQLRERNPELPLIMLSGYPDLPASARQSVDALIIKGAGGPSDLLNAISAHLPRGRQAESVPPVDARNQQLIRHPEELVAPARKLQTDQEKTP